MVEQMLYELRVEGHGACEFRSTRAYGPGDRLCAPPPAGEEASLWLVVAVEPPPPGRRHATLRLVPAR